MSRGGWCFSALLVVLISLAAVPLTARTATHSNEAASTPPGPVATPAPPSGSLVLPPRLCSVDPGFTIAAPPFAGDPGFFLRLPTVAADPGFFPTDGAHDPCASFSLAPATPEEPGGRSQLVGSGSPVAQFFEASSPSRVMPPNERAVATPTS